MDKVDYLTKVLKINFMYLHGPNKIFYWRKEKYVCWVFVNYFVLIINTPVATSLDGSRNTFTKDDFEEIL